MRTGRLSRGCSCRRARPTPSDTRTEVRRPRTTERTRERGSAPPPVPTERDISPWPFRENIRSRGLAVNSYCRDVVYSGGNRFRDGPEEEVWMQEDRRMAATGLKPGGG